MAHTDEHRDKNEASASCSDLQLGWASTRFELGERAGNKADPGKVAADMRT